MRHANCYIENYPRPQLTRKRWMDLCGEWNFLYKPETLSKRLKNGFESEKKITVPFTYETKMSGIGDQEVYNEVWYSRKVNLTKADLTPTVLLHFEGADYFTTVYVNGEFIGVNEGGYHRFSFDIRPALHVGENIITVKITDSLDYSQPRGKQRWHKYSFDCFYVQTTGIWKPVWLEFLNCNYLNTVKIAPDLSTDSVRFEIEPAFRDKDVTCEILITFDNQFIAKTAISCAEVRNSVQVQLATEDSHFNAYYWYPFIPSLYDVEFRFVKNGKVIDEAGSYFGLREIKTDGNKVLINKVPYYFKLVLDQGYFPDSGLTAPSEEALKKDIELAKAMGFNGARKHQKIEDERYLYYADVIGFVVWCEMPSAYCFHDGMANKMLTEWHKIVCQNYNHPSVLAWVPLNESWGVKTISSNRNQQLFADSLYYATKSVDTMRPVISNDGWEHTTSDLLTLHHYDQNPKTFLERYDTLEKLAAGHECNGQKQPFAEGYSYQGQPIVFSEYGGTAFVKDHANGNWGYGVGCKDEKELAERFEGFYQAILKMPNMAGFCYTQLTDVEQEVNGLLDMHRNPKLPIEVVNEILSK